MTHPKPEMVAIPHTGTRPVWLEDDALVIRNLPMGVSERKARYIKTWNHHAYLLPNHWAAPVILANLTPWNSTRQGYHAPDDWDRDGRLMLHDRQIVPAAHFKIWSSQIIGYEPTPAQHPKPAQDVEQGVTQADREAAAKLVAMKLSVLTADYVRSGKADGYGLVEAFRDHRLASSREAELERKLAIAARNVVASANKLDPSDPEYVVDAAYLDVLREALAQIRTGGGG